MSVLDCGLDEVGRGPLAGPVVAAAVVLCRPIDGLADSKALSRARREELAAIVRLNAYVGVAAASVREIERLNILHASMLAMTRAVARLRIRPDRFLVDGNRRPDIAGEVECVVGGDASVPVISAASIIAKVMRDHLMRRLALRYPDYGFERHVGYPTAEHRHRLRAFGITPHHRRSFATVARLEMPLTADREMASGHAAQGREEALPCGEGDRVV